MAIVSSNKLDCTGILLVMVIYVMLGEFFITLSLAKLEDDVIKSFRSVSQPTTTPPQVRLHAGVVASVVVVTIAAILAAAFIIRKYCFPQSDATYRYSVLRQMEDHNAARAEDYSDEDLLE